MREFDSAGGLQPGSRFGKKSGLPTGSRDITSEGKIIHPASDSRAGTFLDHSLHIKSGIREDESQGERARPFHERLLGEIRRRLISEDAVTISYPWLQEVETRRKVSGLTSPDGETHFVLTTSIHINEENKVSPEIERARVIWLDEPTMTAGELRWMNYPFSGSKITTDRIDFTNGDGYNEIIADGEVKNIGVGKSFAGKEYIEAWKESGGVIYFPNDKSMPDEEKEKILAKLRAAQHNQELTDAVIDGYEDDFNAEIATPELPQGLKQTSDLKAANKVFDAIIGTDERSFAAPFETVGGYTSEDVVNAVTNYADSLLMEHGIEQRNPLIERYSIAWETSQGEMQMDVRQGSIKLQLADEVRTISNVFSFYPGTEPNSNFYDSQSQTPGNLARSEGLGLLMFLSWGNPEMKRKIEEKIMQRPEEFKANFRGLRWMLANLRARGEASGENGTYQAIMPEDLDIEYPSDSTRKLLK